MISTKECHSPGRIPLYHRYICYSRTVASNMYSALYFPNNLLLGPERKRQALIMAPSNAFMARIKNTLKRIAAWRPTKKAVPEQPRALPEKASVPEQPQAAPRRPVIHQDPSSITAASTMPTLQIALKNNSTSSQIYAYISEQLRHLNVVHRTHY